MVLVKVCNVPYQALSTLSRMPISGIYKIKGVDEVLAEQAVQGIVKPGEEVVFLPTHTASKPGTGEAFTVKSTISAVTRHVQATTWARTSKVRTSTTCLAQAT